MGVVRLLPAVGHQHVVSHQPLPVVEVALFAIALDGRQQEGQPRRRGGRVLRHGQAGVGRVGQRFQAIRRRQTALGEPGHVVIEADVAVVDRQGAVLRVQLQRVGHVGQRRRLVGQEDVVIERPLQEGVVHAIEHVGQRRVFGQNGLVERLAAVAGLEHLHRQPRLGLERGQHLGADVEAVVGHQANGRALGRFARPAAGRQQPDRQQRQ